MCPGVGCVVTQSARDNCSACRQQHQILRHLTRRSVDLPRVRKPTYNVTLLFAQWFLYASWPNIELTSSSACFATQDWMGAAVPQHREERTPISISQINSTHAPARLDLSIEHSCAATCLFTAYSPAQRSIQNMQGTPCSTHPLNIYSSSMFTVA